MMNVTGLVFVVLAFLIGIRGSSNDDRRDSFLAMIIAAIYLTAK